MAHAARLNLRMQKELKLLLTDPPPGVSLPLLSDNGNPSSSSLSIIEARVEGPEGTVYSKGVFSIRIQIPERYPFQPPNVTFITPIYHPNIDTGGRICLDILNLPPKGAWQPSLNISTVLTSIGLLLSDPNPDDGLMCETSREYKYNRQAFDQKARSWTEKYASAGASGKSSDGGLLAKPSTPQMEVERVVIQSENGVNENEGTHKKLRVTGSKLSLKPVATKERVNNDDKENVAPIKRLSLPRSQNHPVDSASSLSSQEAVTCFEQKVYHVHDEKASSANQLQLGQGSKVIETIVVSDSEESDEGERPSRSRLSLMRKRVLGKWKTTECD